MLSPAEDLFDLQGRTARVTGGARGIGAFIAEGLARAGVRVFVTSRDDAAAQAMAKQLGRDCVGLSADLLRMEDLDRLAQQGIADASPGHPGQQLRRILPRAA